MTVASLVYAATWAVNRSLRDVTGPSMLPTLWPGDRLLTVPTALRAPRTGDVVVAPDPRDRTRRTVKRVAGLAGATVATDAGPLTAGAGQAVLLGDNATASTDSRVFGTVALTDIEAVVVASVRPWRRLV